MNGIFLLLGSNLGKRENNLKIAAKLLQDKEIEIVGKSDIYETEPWGKKDQPWFLNLVLRINYPNDPHQLLVDCQETEKQMGRIRLEKWKERVIDIDILYFENRVINSANLKIPHPEIQNRRFTLLPLVDVAAKEEHPVFQLSQKQLLEKCEDPLRCHKTASIL